MFHKNLFKLILLVVSLFLFSEGPSLGARIPDGGGNSDLLQFTSGGHVLGFKPEGVYVASGDHMLKVTFQNARNVTPITEPGQSSDKKAQPLTKVTYPALWKGISLAYDGIDKGILRSTYTIQPGAKVKDIKLQYNAFLEIDLEGTLRLKYPHGEMTESPPVAWQEIDGKRVSVKVAFRKLGKHDLGFDIGTYNNGYPLLIDPTLEWNTFLGSSVWDYGHGIEIDGSGNAYIIGDSYSTYTQVGNVFVAKLNNNGDLQWNTLLGSGSSVGAYGSAIDSNGNVYVAGYSDVTWGSPLHPFTGQNKTNAFIAKLDSNGVLQWNTFWGADWGHGEVGFGITVDKNENIYFTGCGFGTWGSPIQPFTGTRNAFVAKLNKNGAMQWNTFLGSDWDYGTKLGVDDLGNIYVTGYSEASWGSPILSHSGGEDIFVAKLNNNGVLQWNTFIGSSNSDQGRGLAIDGSGNIYITGFSGGTWGNPIRNFTGSISNAFIAKLSSSGTLQWNTFLGEGGLGYGLTIGTSGYIYATGYSGTSWGSPIRPFIGGPFLGKLDNNGVLQWNTFIGYGNGKDLKVDVNNDIYVTGESTQSWGEPIQPFLGGYDAFVYKVSENFLLNGNPVPTIDANGLSPNSANAAWGQVTLTVSGTNFFNGSVVRWNGNDLATSYVSATQLTAIIPASDTMTGGIYPVTVFNPTPGGGVSNAVNFTVIVIVPFIPSISGVNPPSVIAGGGQFTLTVTGTNFINGSVVRWNGSDRTTTYVSGTQLTATIPASDIATAGTYPVTVFTPINPTSGGGTSNCGELLW